MTGKASTKVEPCPGRDSAHSRPPFASVNPRAIASPSPAPLRPPLVEPVRKAWLSRATGLGKQVEVRLRDQVRAGTFEGLTETGALRLIRDGIAQTIPLDEAMRVPTWSTAPEGRK